MEVSTEHASTLTRADTRAHRPFRTAMVVGAGTMGTQIAAHLANVGLQVLLLDIPGEGPDRNAVARRGLDRAVKMKPDPFFDESARRRVSIGNLEDDLSRAAGVDWLIEAVVEREDVKRSVLRRLAEVAGTDAVISTNTSGIPVSTLAEQLPSSAARRFLGTHFYNPPRYLTLLELVPTAQTDSEVLERVRRFARMYLGKDIVVAKDRPYFVGNRIGVYAMVRAMRLFLDGAYEFEEIETVTGPMTGRPSSATFRTADIVGLDVLLDVLNGMHERLPDDESRSAFQAPSLLRTLVESGATGAKAGAGFYRKEGDTIKRILRDGAGYVPVKDTAVDAGSFAGIPDLRQRLRALYEAPGRIGDIFRETTLDLLAYSARRVPEVTDDPADLDRAMRWGFGWELGPFEWWDAIGFKRVLQDMDRAGTQVPAWIRRVGESTGSIYRRRGEVVAVFMPESRSYVDLVAPRDAIALSSIRSDPRTTIWENEEAALLDLGECVALFEFRSKANCLSQAVMRGLLEALEVVQSKEDIRGVIIGNEGKNFSVGANLAELGTAAARKEFDAVEGYLRQFQEAIQAVYYCEKPVVVAPHQRVLGGACELLMASPHAVASAETYAGLVEVGVGLIPAGTGVMRLASKASTKSPTHHPSHIQPFIQKYFEQVARASVSGSAASAMEMGYLGACAVVVMHDQSRLHAARDQVMRLSGLGYRPPARGHAIRVLGRSGRAALEVAVDQYRQGGFMTDYDAHITAQLAHAMTGGDLSAPQEVSEEYLLDLEREVFLRLLGEEQTQQRIVYMLEHKKPLRN